MLEGKWQQAIVLQALIREFGSGETYCYPQVQSRYLVWCLTGRGQIEVNGRIFNMIPGSFLFTPWNHTIAYLPNLEHPYILGCIHIIPRMLETGDIRYETFHKANINNPRYQLRQDEVIEGLEDVVAFQLTEAHPLFRIASCIVERYVRQAPEAELRLFAQVLLYEIYTAVSDEPSSISCYPPAFKKMLDHIEDYLEMPIKMQGLQFHSHWSVPSIFRAFKKFLGTTPGQYILEQRLSHAVRLLRTTTIGLAELSRNLQFSSYSYFSRCFKRRFSISPREYREKNWKMEIMSKPIRNQKHPQEKPLNPEFLPKAIPRFLRENPEDSEK